MYVCVSGNKEIVSCIESYYTCVSNKMSITEVKAKKEGTSSWKIETFAVIKGSLLIAIAGISDRIELTDSLLF